VSAITSDRELADRARRRGADVVGASTLRVVLDRLDDRD
jgi:hypothetical protein